ncbi:MAG TPA: AMP-dependent synthetase, partial [Blastocatellia bacterium]|nr:AMP-dependent synthetase [Blastocatellia bacterium]
MNDANLLEEQPIAWEPTPEIIERAQLTRFMRQVGVATWDELYAFSIRDVERFTEEVIKFLDIRFDPPYEKLLDVSNGIEFPKWFTTKAKTQNISFAGLNITEMCIDRWQTDEMKGLPAAIWENEDGKIEIITYSQLYEKIEQCAAGLRQNGFQKGDAIGIHLPMQIETITALLAIGRIGAIAVPVFSGYGIEAISSRLNAVEAKALITCDGFSRRGKFFNALEIAEKAASDCPTLKKLFIVRNKKDVVSCQLSAISYSEFDELCTAGKRDLALGQAERTTAEDPLIILYTSGTTGKPKGIAHTHASFPIKAAQDMAFGTDVGCGTRICWYTDIGWMMGPWLIYGALINGATICIYDGAPDYPTPDRMWEFCARHKVEVL